MASVGETVGAAKGRIEARAVEHTAAPKNVQNTQNDGRDVVDLWKAALKSYKGVAGVDITPRAATLEGLRDIGDADLKRLQSSRHDGGKIDRLRTLFSDHLELLDKASKQLADATSSAFPPATIIGSAVTWMLSACSKVSRDYDALELFFSDMNSFLKRVTIMEERMRKEKGLQMCLTEVFSCFLRIWGLATAFVSNGRFKKWITNLLQGDDSELDKARKDLVQKLDNLHEAIQFVSLADSHDIKQMNDELHRNDVEHRQMLVHQTSMLHAVLDGQDAIRADIADVARLLKAVGSQQMDVLTRVEGDIAEYHLLKETTIDGTCTWLFSQPEWLAWAGEGDGGSSDASPKLLAIIGEPGSGKSHIAATVYDRLEQRAGGPERRLCAAHFYFRAQKPDLAEFRNALITAVNQVAEQSPSLQERIYMQIVRDDSPVDTRIWWSLLRDVLQPCFEADTRYRLFLILDGIDELDNEQHDYLVQFWRTIVAEKLHISLVVTSRPDGFRLTCEDGGSSSAGTVHITRELQKSDLAVIVRNHLGNLGHLKRFSPPVKHQISEKIEATAPNLLYAHHMLRHVNAIGREGAVIGQLKKPLPDTLHSLYELMLTTCIRRTVDKHQKPLGVLFCWLAFAFRPLVLDEVVSLLRHVSGDEKFELDDIWEPMAPFLRIGDPGHGSELLQTSEVDYLLTGDIGDTAYEDGQLPVQFRQRAMRSFFCEAAATAKSETSRQLLTTPSEAHRRIFLAAARMPRLSSEPSTITLNRGLIHYATLSLMDHWMLIDIREHSLENRAEIMETLASVMLNQHRFASIAESSGVNYETDFDDSFFERVTLWATEATRDNGLQLSSEASAWWQRVAQNAASGLLELARGQFETIYQKPDGLPTVGSYLTARAALIRSGSGHLLASRAIINFPSIVQVPEQTADAEYDVLGLAGLFDDISMTPIAYHSVAYLLICFGHDEPARSTCLLALSRNPGPAETVMLRYLQSMAEFRLGWTQDASQSITDCLRELQTEGVPESSKRWAFVLKALIEARLGNVTDAAKCFVEAKTFDKDAIMMDNILDVEAQVFWNVGDYNGFITVLRSWTSVERLNWLTAGYSSGSNCRTRHLIFQDAAARVGAHDYIEEVYQDAIKHLEHFDAAAPLRCDLAEAALLVRGDAERARHLLGEVLDSPSGRYPYRFTDEDPRSVLQRAIGLQSRVLRDLFVRSRDESEKAALLDDVRKLKQRPMPLSIPEYSATALLHHDLTIARLTLKMGPRGGFQSSLQKVIDACFNALDDAVSWNDGTSLSLLARALTHLSKTLRDGTKLQRAARVLLSARMSNLDADQDNEDDQGEEGANIGNIEVDTSSSGPEDSVRNGDDTQVAQDDGPRSTSTEQKDFLQDSETGQVGDTTQRDGDSGTPGVPQNDKDSDVPDEGDLSHIPISCDGSVCRQPTRFFQWAGRSLYLCIDCDDTDFCELCYAALQADKNGTAPFQGRRFCGRDHEHIKAPIEGWRGVKDGIMRIEGDEDMPFKEFLRSVRQELCKEAWDEFWEG